MPFNDFANRADLDQMQRYKFQIINLISKHFVLKTHFVGKTRFLASTEKFEQFSKIVIFVKNQHFTFLLKKVFLSL